MKPLTSLQNYPETVQNNFLIAEDNPIDIEVVKSLLHEAYSGQFCLDSAGSLCDTKRMLAAKSYDALILDMNLSGHHCDVGIIEIIESYPEIPIVILTGETDPVVAIESLKVGAQDFLTKNSITPQVLARSLRYAQERKKIELALRNSVASIADRNAQLNSLAHTDHLTQLANRAHFETALEELVYKAQRSKLRFALLYIDLKNFKKVNDNFGHSIGDELLVQVANRLRKTVRSSDFLARVGGDEFVIFTDFLQSSTEIHKLLDRLTKVFEPVFLIESKEILAHPSIGVAFYPEAENVEILLKQADYAMYEGKELQGDNISVCFYTKEMENKYDRQLQLEAQLATAIEENEFSAHFQKVTSLKTDQALVFEALIRWDSKVLGSVSPAEFIPIFENSPVIDQLTKIVISQAKSLIVELSKHDKCVESIKINVAASQLCRSNFSEFFLDLLHQQDIQAETICIELTESQMVKNTQACWLQIERLRNAGIKVALDDFGTGFSSLQHLLEFSVDYLKLDISIIRDINKKSRNQALVAGIIEMGHRLDMQIVAEGVETQQEFDCCEQLQCDMIQGYFLHKPQPITEIVSSQSDFIK